MKAGVIRGQVVPLGRGRGVPTPMMSGSWTPFTMIRLVSVPPGRVDRLTKPYRRGLTDVMPAVRAGMLGGGP
jgi:hypothetical protein